MSDDSIRKLAAHYIKNILRGTKQSTKSTKDLCIFLYEDCPYYEGEARNIRPDEAKSPAYHIHRLEKLIQEWEASPLADELLRIEFLADALHLSEAELEIIRYAYISGRDLFFSSFLSYLNEDSVRKTPASFLSLATSLPKNIIQNDCLSSRKIFDMGIISMNLNKYGRIDELVLLSDDLNKWIESGASQNILVDLIGYPAKTELSAQDFSHTTRQISFIQKILKKAHAEKIKGVNILVYGDTGTGKTEFCKMLGAITNTDVYSVGEHSSENKFSDISRDERLRKLNLSNFLLKENGRSIILFDEMEDLLHRKYSSEKESKIFMNRLLENNPVPTLWTSNDINGFDPAFLRRMSFALELKAPTSQARKKAWNKIAEKNNIAFNNEDITALAKKYDDPPALAETAMRAAKMIGGTKDDVSFVLNGIRKAMGRSVVSSQSHVNENYNMLLNNTDTNLQRLSSQLIDHKRAMAFSLCFYGPSGTGKSAYARYLAEKLEMEVLHIRSSDLMSAFVGGTERNIATAFETARDQEQFLIFDEADSFLMNRESARNSWEITAVNEMLTWMENHPYPFVCTTNLMDRVDSAALRRFTFKIKFDFLNSDQCIEAFKSFFGMTAPIEIKRLDSLTPADFALVLNKAKLLNSYKDADALIKMLIEENSAKNIQSNPIGFLA